MHTLLPYIQRSMVLKLIADDFPRIPVISDKYFCSLSSLSLTWQNCSQYVMVISGMLLYVQLADYKLVCF